MNTHDLLDRAVRVAALSVVLVPVAIAATLGMLQLRRAPLAERYAARLTLAGLGWSFVAAVFLCVVWARSLGHALEIPLDEHRIASAHAFAFALLVDAPSLTMMFVTSLIALLVGRFSIRYLHRSPGFHRYFVLLNVFVAGMQLLVMADSYDLLLVGWEFVGLSSMLLIGYFRDRPGPQRGALRAMVTYRVTDVGLLFAAILVHHAAASPDFGTVFGGSAWPPRAAGLPSGVATATALLLLFAVTGKSALFPLGGWLPKAMEGPTPSSALFYGALSIHAGVFLLLRSMPLFLASEVASVAALALGAVSAAYATVVGRVQSDAKNRLAYATMAQVGLMVAAIGLHFHRWVLVHMVAHACLRLYQLLRAPSALRDAEETRAALAELPPSRPSLFYRLLPQRVDDRLYFLALARFSVDERLDAWFVEPLLRLARRIADFERTLDATAGGDVPAPQARGTEAEART